MFGVFVSNPAPETRPTMLKGWGRCKCRPVEWNKTMISCAYFVAALIWWARCFTEAVLKIRSRFIAHRTPRAARTTSMSVLQVRWDHQCQLSNIRFVILCLKGSACGQQHAVIL